MMSLFLMAILPAYRKLALVNSFAVRYEMVRARNYWVRIGAPLNGGR
jgi:hypothetical protein